MAAWGLQVSSPIRRYSDLLAHWQLKAALRGSAGPFTAPALEAVLEQLAATQRQLARVEAAVRARWLAQYFRQEQARDPDRAWAAVLVVWQHSLMAWGRVMLPELGLEVRPALSICLLASGQALMLPAEPFL